MDQKGLARVKTLSRMKFDGASFDFAFGCLQQCYISIVLEKLHVRPSEFPLYNSYVHFQSGLYALCDQSF